MVSVQNSLLTDLGSGYSLCLLPEAHLKTFLSSQGDSRVDAPVCVFSLYRFRTSGPKNKISRVSCNPLCNKI